MPRPTLTARRPAGARRRRATHIVLVATVLLAGCGTGADDGPRSTPRDHGPARLTFPSNVDDVARATTLEAIRDRLRRFGVDARVRRTTDAVTISPRPDPYVVEAIAWREPTRVATLGAGGPGRCGGGTATRSPWRCPMLGDTVATTAAIRTASVGRQSLDGFGVDVTVDSASWPSWRDAFRPQLGRDLAIVSGDLVLAQVRASVMGLQTRIGGQLREQDARRLAAGLVVDTPLPVELTVNHPAPQVGARPGEVWTASLAVNVCGRWLPPAPAFASEAGVHSHADGLVYVHSLPRSEAGRRLTLGQFLGKGHWQMSTQRLALWRGVDVRPRDPCGARRDTRITWSVDGVERTGQPSNATLLPGRAFVVVFGTDGQALGPPPAVVDPARTTWGPRRSS